MDDLNDASAAVEAGPDGTVLVLCGEIDLAVTDELGRRIADLLDDDLPGLVVDLAGVTFLDSSALAMLVGIARRQRGSLLLRNVRPVVERAIELTGLDDVLVVER